MTISTQTDPVLDRLVARLEGEEGCRTIILYGSRARGDAGPDSDYDLIGFRDREGPPARETGVRDGALLDVFIYPIGRLAEPGADLLHVRGGRALRDRDGQGAAFLVRLDEVFAAGPDPLPADEIAARRNWAWKMLGRAVRGDIEGHFRRAWLLTMQLENFFHEERMVPRLQGRIAHVAGGASDRLRGAGTRSGARRLIGRDRGPRPRRERP
jgi:Nucleotidyltransferase domain